MIVKYNIFIIIAFYKIVIYLLFLDSKIIVIRILKNLQIGLKSEFNTYFYRPNC
jgi:hypothetical protein